MFCVRRTSRMLAYRGHQGLCHRFLSSLVNIKKDKEKGTATLFMNRPPLNILNTEMLAEMKDALETIESDKSMEGLIIATENPAVFSAGLDLFELYQISEERYHKFWRTLQDFWIKLYSSRLATIAAISGHAPAGGCLTAISCDHRIMADGKFAIGLNETQFGLIAPYWFADTMKNVIGHIETERALMFGKLFSSQEALQIGLVDQLQPQEQVLPAAQEQITRWMQVPGKARLHTKLHLRGPAIERLSRGQRKDAEAMLAYIQQDWVQESLGKYLDSLRRKPGKASKEAKS